MVKKMSNSQAKMVWGSSPEFYGPRHLFRVRMMADCLAQALPGGRVLDAGSGNGSLLVALARRGYQVEGVDLSEALVRYARQLIEREGLSHRAKVRVGDVTRLDYPDGCFDGLTSGEVLEHVLDHERAVSEFHRVLRPGGVCVVTVPAHRRRYDWLDEWAGHWRRYEKDELRELFEGAGFEVDLLRYWGFPFMSIYHRLVHKPILRRKALRPDDDAVLTMATGLGRNPLLVRVACALFRLDRLFAWAPWGVGLLLRARRKEDDE